MKRDTVQDPVCGMRLSAADAVGFAEWSGRRYGFCSETCQRTFGEDPTRYFERNNGGAGRTTIRLPLVGLACVAGDRLPLERGLRAVPGVLEAYVNPADDAAHLEVDRERFRIEAVLAELERFGVRAIVPSGSEKSG